MIPLALKPKKKIDTTAVDTLAFYIKASGLPVPDREYCFARHLCGGDKPGMRERLRLAGLQDWRFDYAWPALKVALEMDGGGYVAGRHSRGRGMDDDARKLSIAVADGWRVLRVTPKHVKNGEAVNWVAMTLKVAGRA